jgi:hypothetical protein
MLAVIDGIRYRVEFSYRRKVGKHPSIARNSPVEGLTACAIVRDEEPFLVSVAAAMCSAGDKWSRREGRKQAFDRAVRDCGILRLKALEFLEWFDARFPAPAFPVPKPRRCFSAEEIEQLRSAGRAELAALAGALPSSDQSFIRRVYSHNRRARFTVIESSE